MKAVILNIQRILDQNPYVEEPILNCPVHCLLNIIHYLAFFKINLFENFIKQHEMNLEQFTTTVTNISKFLWVFLWTNYECCSYHIL